MKLQRNQKKLINSERNKISAIICGFNLLIVIFITIITPKNICYAFCDEEKQMLQNCNYENNLLRIQRNRIIKEKKDCLVEKKNIEIELENSTKKADKYLFFLWISIIINILTFLCGIGLGSIARKKSKEMKVENNE